MKHILIPTDFSVNSWNAIKYATCLFNYDQCTFYILHVDDLSNSDINGNSILVMPSSQKNSAQEKLDRLFRQITQLTSNKSHRFIALRDYGNFIDVVKKTVKEKKIDLIVMGTKGASSLKATIFGSNTSSVITKVPCNVLAIPENTEIKRPNKIGFPTDFNLFYTYPILNSLTEILQISNATLDVVYITQSIPNFTNSQLINQVYLYEYLKEIFTDSHNFKNIQGTDVRETILNYITENRVEMLTLVAKNLNLFQQLFFNNPIEQLSYHISVPLLVMHE